MSGEEDIYANQPPIVEFTNVPADGDTFSYAPVIHWKGRDCDGFVEYYDYADIIDSTALSNPVYYIDFIPDEAWVRDTTTSDTIYLLTEAGQVTEHIFYVKCADDQGAESEVIYRTFYRMNQPPYVPEIKWWSDSDTSFFHDLLIIDTLYCLDEITDTWPGLGFAWRSSDPDDSDLYTIPLEFRYYLEKVPHDTVWEWVSTGWSNRQELQFAGLETGHYYFTVWVRDDGFESSVRSATATFDVYRPTFEQSVLLLNTTSESPPAANRPGWYVTPGTQIGELYQTLTIDRFPDAEYLHYPTAEIVGLPKSLLGRFKLVIWFSESQAASDGHGLEGYLRNYVQTGGRLWVVGIFTHMNVISNSTLGLAESFFESNVDIRSYDAEFVGAISGVSDLPDLWIDTSRTGEIHRERFIDNGIQFDIYPLLPGVDVMSTGGVETTAETAYYFKSYTDTASGDVFDDLAEVRTNVDTIYYPPTPVDCIIALSRNKVLEITRVMNITRGDSGEVLTLTNNVLVGNRRVAVARVSYLFGEPWSVTDTVEVDYRFQPYSEFHMRPCAVRYEKVSESREGQGFEVRYRLAVFTFPFYFMDDSQGQVTRMFHEMLDWFFLPYAH